MLERKAGYVSIVIVSKDVSSILPRFLNDVNTSQASRSLYKLSHLDKKKINFNVTLFDLKCL